FFTEGTELFSKGDLFYSRRVGGSPSGSVALADNEEIDQYPGSVDLINALKISGRTDKGLGIGFFNAITERTDAKIRNTDTGEIRSEMVEPFTNYNVFVLDQRFGDNSSVSLVNTNVIRDGDFRDANATGLYTSLTNNKNTMNYWASAEGSWVLEDETKFGVEGDAGLSKINGKHRISAEISFRTKDYDINDLGYSTQTNRITYYGYYGYRYLQPKGFLNNLYLNFNLRLNRRLDPDLYNNFVFNFNSSFTTKKFFNFGGGFETTPFQTNDIYEPRVEGRFVKVPTYYNPWVWLETDYRKKLALSVVFDWYKYDEQGRGLFSVDFSPTYRVSDKFRLNFSTNVTLSDKEQGFVNFENDQIIFGQRDRNTIINSLESTYIFNNKMSLNLAFRHYYSDVIYDKFYDLDSDGSLAVNNYLGNHDATYNSWNVDLRFAWWFAPGSQMTLLYRNATENYLPIARQSFNNNFSDLFDQPQLNSLSLRISYYLDYNRVKNWFNAKQMPNTPTISTRKMGVNQTGFVTTQ
ncbi:MAG: DUF5916 domain-containing protein, partial [Leeuwenhoekiella sp.]